MRALVRTNSRPDPGDSMFAVVRHVLVAYDGSSAARRALEHAADLAGSNDRMTVVNVMREPGVSARAVEPPPERIRQEQILDDASEYLADRGIEARTLAKIGDSAAHEILTAADNVGADVLVVARRRGRTAHILGSTSSRIVQSAKCDVLVVHDGSPEPD